MNRFIKRIVAVISIASIVSVLIALFSGDANKTQPEMNPVLVYSREQMASKSKLKTTAGPKRVSLTLAARQSPPVVVQRKNSSGASVKPPKKFYETILERSDFKKQDHQLKWIKLRITRSSDSWESARHTLFNLKPELFQNPKRILLFPGLLSEYSAYDFAANAFKGGYLGELVQWSDLIAAVFALNHDVRILTRKRLLEAFLKEKQGTNIDLVYTDYIGLHAFRDLWFFPKLKCKFRILDSFGTEPIFNFRTKDINPKTWEMFSNWNFEDTRQFMTFFPHTPDNSFLGFVIQLGPVNATHKEDFGVVYGKEGRFYSGKESYLNTVADSFKLYATVKDPLSPSLQRINNLGILEPGKLFSLLDRAKLFVGLGFPYDGPAPLEAIAHGCVFLQPRFNPPRSSETDDFFKGKPSSRGLTSQHPYLEKLVGEPYIMSVDLTNEKELEATLQKIKQMPSLKPFIPYEFTAEGFLERIGVYIHRQSFCDGVNVAEGKKAFASSILPGHSPGEVVDGKLDHQTCFWSEKKTLSWWKVDLEEEIKIRKICVTNMFDWYLAKSWVETFIAPFKVSLLGANNSEVAAKTYFELRLFYIWNNVGKVSRFVRLSSLKYKDSRYFVICNIEVYVSEEKIWPDPSLLVKEFSSAGESCSEACYNSGMVCERSYFVLINSFEILSKYGKCSEKNQMSGRSNQFFPAVSVGSDAQCYVNSEPMIFSCAGQSSQYKRLCPCRKYNKYQIALPEV